MSERLTRQQLYDRIAETSKDEFVLSEMKRLGFWDNNAAQPSLAETLIQKEVSVNKELNELLEKQRRYDNRLKMLTEMRAARMKASKEKQAETKRRNEEKRQLRAKAWKEQKEQTLVYLGEGVSGGLQNTEADLPRLQSFGLSHFENPLALAQAMQIPLGRLRFLAFNRKVATVSHYKRFYLPKKSGGKRLISAPMPLLKAAQHWILENILNKIPVSPSAHGFVAERSIVSNALPHVGKEVVVNLDLKNFFPTLTFKRVKGLYRKLGYSEQMAGILALLCTEPDVEAMEVDRKKYFVAKTERFLPQGSPASPAITNLICYKLDRRFEGLARKFDFTYTRYADDLTFSGSGEAAKLVGQLLWSVKQIVESEGFVLHPEKLKVMYEGTRQEVTGLTVNNQLGVDRKTRKKFRALLHQIGKDGVKGKTWGTAENLADAVLGYASFVQMVKPEQGKTLKEEAIKVLGKTSSRKPSEPKTAVPKKETPPSDVEKPKDDKDWWDVL
jgi:RNA-directed DNA polymerase